MIFFLLLLLTYSVDLEQHQARGIDPCAVGNVHVTLTPSKLSCPLVSTVDWFRDRQWITKSVDAQIPYEEWLRSIHTVSPLHPRTPSLRWKAAQVFIEKHLHVSGPYSSSHAVPGSPVFLRTVATIVVEAPL